MTIALVLVLSVIASGGSQALLDKLHLRVERAPGFHAAYDITINKHELSTVVDLKYPLHLKATISQGTNEMTFIQTPNGEMVIDPGTKLYFEYSPFTKLSPPPAKGALSLAIPDPILNWLPLYSSGEDWTATDKADGLHDLVSVQLVEGVTITRTITMDDSGRMTAYRRVNSGADSSEELLYTLKSEDLSDQGQSKISDDPPIGYVPGDFRRELDVPKTPDFPRWPEVNDARTGESESINKLFQGKPYVLVVTSPECDPSSKMEDALRHLSARLSSQGAGLVEVSLTGIKPDLTTKDQARRILWDPAGKSDLKFGFPMTPYMVVVDKSGKIVRGWAGFAPEDESKMIAIMMDGIADSAAASR